MRKVGVILLLGLVFLGGCKKEDSQEDVTPTPAPELYVDCQFQFTPNVNCKQEDGVVVENTKEVRLYLGDARYYSVVVPANMDVVTDYASYVYAKDSSVSVTLVPGANPYNYVRLSDIKNPVNESETIAVSMEAESGPKEAVLYFDEDKILILRAYDNSDAFETILEGFRDEDIRKLRRNNIKLDKLVSEEIDEVPEYDTYVPTVVLNSDIAYRKYEYEDGVLFTGIEMRKFEDAKENMISRAIIVNEDNVIRKVCNKEKVFYLEMGKVTVAVLYYNFNASITLFGVGDEAKCNITKFIHGQ